MEASLGGAQVEVGAGVWGEGSSLRRRYMEHRAQPGSNQVHAKCLGFAVRKLSRSSLLRLQAQGQMGLKDEGRGCEGHSPVRQLATQLTLQLPA